MNACNARVSPVDRGTNLGLNDTTPAKQKTHQINLITGMHREFITELTDIIAEYAKINQSFCSLINR